jgi:PD-(D/E)XK nuclease superfamily
MGMSRSGHVSDSSPPSISYQQTYSIIGAAMKVHRVLGCGFLEAVYRAALLAELQVRGVPCQAEVLYQIAYKDRALPLLARARAEDPVDARRGQLDVGLIQRIPQATAQFSSHLELPLRYGLQP